MAYMQVGFCMVSSASSSNALVDSLSDGVSYSCPLGCPGLWVWRLEVLDRLRVAFVSSAVPCTWVALRFFLFSLGFTLWLTSCYFVLQVVNLTWGRKLPLVNACPLNFFISLSHDTFPLRSTVRYLLWRNIKICHT